MECTDQKNKSELILVVKKETRHHVEVSFGSEIPVVCNHCGVMAAEVLKCQNTQLNESNIWLKPSFKMNKYSKISPFFKYTTEKKPGKLALKQANMLMIHSARVSAYMHT